MASSSRASFTSKSRNTMRTKWLNNAMKSLGSSTKSVLKDMSPNIYDTVSTGTKTSRNIISSLKTNGGNLNRVQDTLKSNKYVRFASSAYKNALSDIKSGNFNNTGRESDVMEKSMFGDDGFSFGDEDTGSDVYNIDAGVSDAALSNISNQMRTNTEATIKANKANMDAYLAVSSASMFQSQQIGSEIIGHLSNISSGISSLVEYQNENMSKFIEASMVYYDRMGSKGNNSYVASNSKMTANSVYGNKNGGINLSQYKNYVKQQMKDNLGSSNAGIINEMLSDDMLQMAAANPLGFASKGLIKWMIPKVVSTSIQSAEATFSSFLPTMLSQMADWGDEYASGILGSAKQFIGKTFGVRTKKKTDLKATINKDAVPFDGETKHAITEIITKELRTQTSYLKVIANKLDKNGAANAVADSEVFDYASGKYIKQGDVIKNVLSGIKESYVDTMKSGRFGKSMDKFVKAQSDPKTQAAMNDTMEKFMYFLAQSNNHVDPINDKNGSYAKALKSTGGSKNDKIAIDKYIKELAKKDPASFYDLSRSINAARQSGNDKKKAMEEDPTYYNLFASGLNGTEDIDELVTSELGLSKATKNKKRKYNSVDISQPFAQSSGDGKGLSAMVSNGINGATGMMTSFMKGDGKGAFKAFADMAVSQVKILYEGLNKSLLTPIKETLFGKKDENGYTDGGMFAGVQNSFKDFIGSFRQNIDGKEWTDSKGNKHEAKDNSMFSVLKNMGNNVRNGIMVKLFGEQDIDENGNPAGDKQKDGLLSKITGSFAKGLQGWKEAFLGKDGDDPEKQKEEISKRLKDGMDKYLPSTLAGGAVGTGIGIVGGSSILGTLVGGPFAGAALGAVGGFLSKNEKFQHWLFGDEDKDNGKISKSTQEFFKKNKNFLVGSAAVGAVSGAVTGGGLLGTLVGGPVAGAIMGTATGLITKSKMFQEFLYGDEKTGQEGIIKKVKDGLSKMDKSGDGDDSTTDMGNMVGMGAIGAGAGGLMGMLVGGPLVGGVLGLGASILAQKDNFHEWMFGKKDKDGNRTKEGVVGQFKNMLKVQLVGPMTTGVMNLVEDMKSTIKFDILDPIRFAAKPLTEGLAKFANNLKDRVSGMLNNVGDALKKNVIGPIGDLIISPMRKMFSGVTKMVYGVTKKIVTSPFKLLQKVTDHMTSSIHVAVTEIKDTIKGGLKKFIFDPINKAMKAVTGMVGKVIKTVITAPFKFIGGASSYIADKYLGVGGKHEDDNDYSGMDEKKARRLQRKTELANNRAKARERRIRDKNRLAIAKASNYQLTDDTEENREIAKSMGAKINDRIGAEEGKAGKDAKIQETLKNETVKTNSWLSKIFDAITGIKTETEENHKEDADKQDELVDAVKDNTNSDDVPISPRPASVEQQIRSAGGIGKYLSGKFDKTKIGKFFKKRRDKLKGSETGAPDSGDLPQFAEGGETSEDGAALVGENGPEIAAFPKGTKVIPTNKPVGVYIMGAVPGWSKGGKAHNDVANDVAKDKKNDERARIEDEKNKKDTLADIKQKGMDVLELKDKAEKEKAEKVQQQIVDNTKAGAEATKEHTSIWSKIFSKKGLITGGLLLLTPFLLKNLPGLIKGVGDLIEWVKNKFGWVQDNDALTDGNGMGEQAVNNAKDIGSGVSQIAKGNIAGGIGTLINGSDGESDHQSGARAKLITKIGAKGLNKVGKAGSAIVKGVVKAGKAIAKTGAAKAVGGAIKTSALGKGVANVGTKVAETKGGKLLTTVISAIKSFCGGVVKGFNKGTAAKIGEDILASQTDEVVEVVTKNFPKISAKIGGIVGATAALGATVVGLAAKETTWVVLGALNGATGAARLFQVDSSHVDAMMIAISTAIGAAAGTTIGSIIDVVNELVVSITGIDFITAIAGMIYSAVSGSDKSAKLNDGQKEFQDKYKKYQDTAIEEQYKTQLAAGLIDSSLTLEQFSAGVHDGTYKAKYDSFADYNDDKHKTAGAHIAGGLKKVGKTVASPFVGAKRALFGYKAQTFTDDNGTSYEKQKDGSYAVTDKNGKSLGIVAEDAVNTANMKQSEGSKGVLGKAINTIGNGIVGTVSKVAESAKTIGSTVFNTAKNLIKNAISGTDDAKLVIKDDDPMKSIKMTLAGGTKVLMSPVTSIIKIGGMVYKKLIKPVIDAGKDMVQFAQTTYTSAGAWINGEGEMESPEIAEDDPMGGLKKADFGIMKFMATPVKFIKGGLDSIGDKIKSVVGVIGDIRTTIGDIGTGTKDYILNKTDDITLDIAEDDPIAGVKHAAVNVAKFISTPFRFISGVIKKAGDGIKSFIAPIGEIGKDIKKDQDAIYDKDNDLSFNDYFKNPHSDEDGIAGTIKTVLFYINRVTNFIPWAIKKAMGTIGSKLKGLIKGFLDDTVEIDDSDNKDGGSGKGHGGRGSGDSSSGTVNNFTYYAQNDPKWKDKKYGSDGATMGDSGCGPAAMSMVASELTGSQVTPTAMAGLAQMTGDRDSTGTNWNFINNASNAMGIQSTELKNPSGDYIANQVSAGNPMILSGTSGNSGPYTSAGHYIVATGSDSKGNIKVNDPRGRGYSRTYSPEELGKRTGASWTFTGGRGAKRLRGGRGPEATESTGTKVVASDVVYVALNEVGYQEKSVNENLNDMHTRAGDKNYTKYGVLTKTNGQPWCCSFIVWCMYKASNNDMSNASKLLGGTTSAACQTVYQTLSGKQRITKTPAQGDLIFYSSEGNGHSNHIGLVVGVNGDGTITTVEGNTSGTPTGFDRDGGCVAKKTVELNSKRIMGFGRPFYDGTSSFKGVAANGPASPSGTVGGNSIGDVTADYNVGGASATSGSSSDGTSILSTIGNFFSEFGSRAMNGIFTGNYNSDYSSIFGGTVNSNGNTEVTNADGSTSEIPMQTDDTDYQVATGGSMPEKVWNFLKGKGLSNEAIAAVMGNMHHESSMNPTAANKYSTAYGLCQWLGGRRKNLKAYASSVGKTESDPDTQLNYLWNELSGSEKKSLGVLQKGGDVSSLTTGFEKAFERSSDTASYPKRISAAQQYFNQFANTSTASATTTGGGAGLGRRGGRGTGATVNYGSSLGTAANASRQSYSNATKAANYTANNTSSVSGVLNAIVSILSSIDNNTAGSTDALNALKSLQGTVTSNTTNVNNVGVANNGGTSPASNAVILDKANESKVNRDQIMAQRIARGY